MDAILQAKYEIQNPDEVEAWLRQYPEIGILLDEAYDVIQRIFGTTITRLEVALRHDAEFGELDAIWCYIYTNLVPEQALTRADQFLDEWFLANQQRADGKLNITVTY